MPTVAVIRGDNRRENVRRALEVLPASELAALASATRVLIKPNLVHHLNQLASTHVDAVRAVADFVRARTAAPIVVGDASYHGTKPAFRNFGYERLRDEYRDLALADLNDDETVPGFYVKRDGSRGEMGISKTIVACDFRISLGCMKTHRDVGVSLSIKNLIGCWVAKPRYGLTGKYWPRFPFLHEQGPNAHNATIAELHGQIPFHLGVIDGFQAMEGDGPTRGTPVDMRVALAGTSLLATDAVACRLMGIDPDAVAYLAKAAQKCYDKAEEWHPRIAGSADWEPFVTPFQRS